MEASQAPSPLQGGRAQVKVFKQCLGHFSYVLLKTRPRMSSESLGVYRASVYISFRA